MPLLYADSSALVKLVRSERETPALIRYIGGADIVSSELALAEVHRAIVRAAADDPGLPLHKLRIAADAVLDSIGLVPIDGALLVAAGSISEPALRTLDAIHLATALDVSPIDAFVSYDSRQRAAAELAGLDVAAP